jgi:transcriptional regulator with XRE-family HTH domain
MARRLLPLEEWEAEQMRDPEFVTALAELEPAHQVARLRILRGLTQEQLAELVGTKQPGIARLESGASTPTLSFLGKVAEALGARLEVRLVPLQEEEQMTVLHEDGAEYASED